MKKLIVSIVLVLAACASPKPKAPEAEAPAVPPAEVTAPAPTPEAKSAPAPVVEVDVDPLNDSTNMLAKRSFYYPRDVSAVQEADKPVVAAHAKYLNEHPDRKVHVEGNADERGSNEYNLALGQRRADGLKQMLMLGGAKASQIETASYGEEKPKATGHDEAAWSQNRRSDIKY